MSHTLENPAELTVSDLFTSGQYIIPMYQRNYAWGKVEIEQLLQDVMDAASQEPKKDYYLGSLVVHQRKDGKFEMIDGQQRHTTLCILMAALKNTCKESIVSQGINLTFEHRDLSSETLKFLFDNGLKSDAKKMESAMVAAYQIALTFLNNNADNQKFEIKAFAQYLVNHVKLLRVIVPEDTDLNHYFEIMNSRGEQLEKHEVLKARLMEPLAQKEQSTFAKIWVACADMSRYVQLGFSASKTIPEDAANGEKISERVAVFGEDWNQCPENFDDLVKRISGELSSDEGKTLASFLDEPISKTHKDTAMEDGKYGSVINFPNFLLQVLLVLDSKHEITLDDKKLLDSFEAHPQYKANSAQFAKNFIVALLQMRFLFDCWVIKSTSDGDGDHWRLRTIKPPADKNSSYSFVNSATDEKINHQLLMMLSMRHVSFPSQNYKLWLKEALRYLYENKKDIDGANYLTHLEGLSDQFFKDRCTDDSVLHKGTGVLHFFFNRLDYLLWKKIVIDSEMPSTGNKDSVKKLAESFRFTFRNSVEHHYAQHLDEIAPLDKSKISCDSFGNLCLITHQSNSRLSDRSPHDKALHQSDNASIKQAIMMSYDNQWGAGYEDNMLNHQSEMIALLKAPQP